MSEELKPCPTPATGIEAAIEVVKGHRKLFENERMQQTQPCWALCTSILTSLRALPAQPPADTAAQNLQPGIVEAIRQAEILKASAVDEDQMQGAMALAQLIHILTPGVFTPLPADTALVEALTKLVAAARETSRQGAIVGPHFAKLSMATLKAESALAKAKP